MERMRGMQNKKNIKRSLIFMLKCNHIILEIIVLIILIVRDQIQIVTYILKQIAPLERI